MIRYNAEKIPNKKGDIYLLKNKGKWMNVWIVLLAVAIFVMLSLLIYQRFIFLKELAEEKTVQVSKEKDYSIQPMLAKKYIPDDEGLSKKEKELNQYFDKFIKEAKWDEKIKYTTLTYTYNEKENLCHINIDYDRKQKNMLIDNTSLSSLVYDAARILGPNGRATIDVKNEKTDKILLHLEESYE